MCFKFFGQTPKTGQYRGFYSRIDENLLPLHLSAEMAPQRWPCINPAEIKTQSVRGDKIGGQHENYDLPSSSCPPLKARRWAESELRKRTGNNTRLSSLFTFNFQDSWLLETNPKFGSPSSSLISAAGLLGLYLLRLGAYFSCLA